jgi:cytochrome c-type biogenesis protein CcmF
MSVQVPKKGNTMSLDINWGVMLITAALFFSIAALVFAVMTAAGKGSYAAPARIIYLFTSVCISASLIVLLYYFIRFDFRIAYVYENSSRDLPLMYRIAALWAGKEGSFLLWLFFLNILGIFVLYSDKGNEPIVSSIILLTQIFILVILAVESPFSFIWDKHPGAFGHGFSPTDGLGLNPLLEDPWMVAHPPMLFIGYASATIPFGYAVSAMIKSNFKEWLHGSYPWLLFSMVTLGIGIFLGAYWAYTVLGWGGYWGWDSVENSSLIPWIIAIALVHGFIVQKRTGMLARTNLFLAILFFLMVLYSAWLTRSGVLSNFSVHSFSASKISFFLLLFFLAYLIGSIALIMVRFRETSGEKVSTQFFDWRTFTVYGIIVLFVYAAIISIGTSMPIISSAIAGKSASVTEAFYNNFSVPFGILILSLMALSTAAIGSRRRFNVEYPAIALVSIAAGILINAGFTASPVAYIFTCASFFLVASSVRDMLKAKSRAIIPSRLTHIGVGLLLIGIITSNFPSVTMQKKLIKGKESELGPARIVFTGFKEGEESFLNFKVWKDSTVHAVQTVYRFDQKTGSLYREPYIIHGFLDDLYISPEMYASGVDEATNLVLAKGEKKELGGVSVRFIGFRTEHMTSGEPTTFAELVANGTRIAPGVTFKRSGIIRMDQTIPGTNRIISLRDIDASTHSILLYISPARNMAIPHDSVIVALTVKRLIWIVWLGTVVITVGGAYTFVRTAGKKA